MWNGLPPIRTISPHHFSQSNQKQSAPPIFHTSTSSHITQSHNVLRSFQSSLNTHNAYHMQAARNNSSLQHIYNLPKKKSHLVNMWAKDPLQTPHPTSHPVTLISAQAQQVPSEQPDEPAPPHPISVHKSSKNQSKRLYQTHLNPLQPLLHPRHLLQTHSTPLMNPHPREISNIRNRVLIVT